jgi:hypothetical protein
MIRLLPLLLPVLLLSACPSPRPVRPPVTPTPDVRRSPCPGEFAWPRWQDLFERFAADRQFMHRYLFNGVEVWP